MRLAVAAAALTAVGCHCKRASVAAGETPAFVLTCRAANTASRGQVHCVRNDTRTGDIVRVDFAKLPISNGSTASAAGPAGRYQLECAATATDQRADFYCVRLNTETGEMLLINLTKVGQVPAAAE